MSLFRRSAFRIVPVGFALGAFIEFFMINVRIGSETFCISCFALLTLDDTAIRLKVERDHETENKKE